MKPNMKHTTITVALAAALALVAARTLRRGNLDRN